MILKENCISNARYKILTDLFRLFQGMPSTLKL